ncbi:MAG: histidine kinase, gyrase and HSP90-like ATPase family protein [Steroidobacteraceae bacterium]|nr:histidine kinase, gyrase and HSP90-like ATPase family protein [Steroidobacteraceae bacterium]
MNFSSTWSRPLPRILFIAGLLLLLVVIFSSQLFFAGYVTPWSRAFLQEGLYWLSCGVLAWPIMQMCRYLRRAGLGWIPYTLTLSLGAVAAVVLQPVIAFVIAELLAFMDLCLYGCGPGPESIPRDRQLKALELESMLHQAQLQALRSQLNPHFLFNALHSIAELVHENPGLAEKLIIRLGELLRQVLQSSTLQEVSLADELDFIRGYVDIEQMRLGERLRVEWDVPAELLTAAVPSLLLQPLVENAIQHGIAPTATPGVLTIRARRDSEFLVLEVRDTGPGMTREGDRFSGIGLTNTSARLQRLYGGRQELELIDADGLLVRVRIPFRTP